MEEEALTSPVNTRINLKVKRFINNPVPSNCYILYDILEPTCIILDPGTKDISELIFFLSSNLLTPLYIILTHEHFDHIAGVNSLIEKYACKVISTEACSSNITNPKRNFSLFYDQQGFSCQPANIQLGEKYSTLAWNDNIIELLATPGHSEGGLCIAINGLLFTGDTLLKNYKTVVKLPGGSKEKLIHSFEELKYRYDGITNVYPGHGDNFLLSEVTIKSII
jgi:hydroxyacylglutathione hydrolase